MFYNANGKLSPKQGCNRVDVAIQYGDCSFFIKRPVEYLTAPLLHIFSLFKEFVVLYRSQLPAAVSLRNLPAQFG